MATTFTAEIDQGDERGDVAFSNGGTTTTGVTLIVETTKLTTKGDLLRAIEVLENQIRASDYPPA